MSFADPTSRSGARAQSIRPNSSGTTRGRPRYASASRDEPATIERPSGSSYRRSVDWERVGLVGAGLLVGALFGAGAALLLAPQSGPETRLSIRRHARHAGSRASDAWADLADELAAVARRGRRRARRALRRARWRASDAIA